MEAGTPQLNEHTHDLTDLVGQGFSWAVYALAALAIIIGGVLLTKYLVVKLSPRRLCESCNRYYSTRKSLCPFCGAEPGPEARGEAAKDNRP